MAPQIKLIATDLDGTLLDDSNQISEANTRVLRAAVEQGVTVCIATGRSHSSASQFVTELGIEDSLIISYNLSLIHICNIPRREGRSVDIIQRLDAIRAMLDRTIPGFLPESAGPAHRLLEAMRYSTSGEMCIRDRTILGAFALGAINLDYLASLQAKSAVISVYLEDDADAGAIEAKLYGDLRVKETEFVSKQQALQEWGAMTGVPPEKLQIIGDPLPDLIRVRVVNPDDLAAVAEFAAQLEGVSEAPYNQPCLLYTSRCV